MKQPVVDYRKFRFSKLNDPEFSHLKLLAGWLVYFLFYFLTENFIPYDACHVMHSRLDDLIPFNEFFFIPYCFWYVLIVISLGYFLLYDIENFKNLQKYIIITQVVAMAVYIVYPSIQDLRPTEFARDNFFTHLAAFIYKMDTPTGVCPSLHVAYSLGIGSCWLKESRRESCGRPLWSSMSSSSAPLPCSSSSTPPLMWPVRCPWDCWRKFWSSGNTGRPSSAGSQKPCNILIVFFNQGIPLRRKRGMPWFL